MQYTSGCFLYGYVHFLTNTALAVIIDHHRRMRYIRKGLDGPFFSYRCYFRRRTSWRHHATRRNQICGRVCCSIRITGTESNSKKTKMDDRLRTSKLSHVRYNRPFIFISFFINKKKVLKKKKFTERKEKCGDVYRKRNIILRDVFHPDRRLFIERSCGRLSPCTYQAKNTPL